MVIAFFRFSSICVPQKMRILAEKRNGDINHMGIRNNMTTMRLPVNIFMHP